MPPEEIENYVIEILSRSKTIQRRCRKLSAQEFASESPRLLVKTISRICSYLEEAVLQVYRSIEWGKSFEEGIRADVSTLKYTDTFIRYLGEHLRYIDGAVTRKLPWSIIKPVEKLFQSITPGILFMFRPQWKYNYSIVTDDLRNFYFDSLEEFEDITERSREEVFEDLKGPFHIISFPSIERKNILLHCLVGHELGHLIVGKYKFINEELIKNFTKRIGLEVKKIIMERYHIHFSTLDMFKQFHAKQEVQSSIETTQQIWKRGLEEILADIIGTLIFGPSMLFSMYELSLQKKLDHIPGYSNSFYPAWRYRLRGIINILQRHAASFFPITPVYSPSNQIFKKVNERFELIKKLTLDKPDLEAIKKDALVEIAYREIEKDIDAFIKSTNYFKKELKKKILTPPKLYKDIEHLVKRIKNGLPPNAVENSIEKRRPAALVEIINAAWFYKISSNDKLLKEDGKINEEIFSKKETLNRLTLKAIEYSDIETEYKNKTKKGLPGGKHK